MPVITYNPMNTPNAFHENVAGANKHNPCMNAMNPPYVKSLAVHSLFLK
jgi:hypothetical protein